MGAFRLDLYDAGRMKLGGDSYFVYTAYAPMDEAQVLVKVGISTIPYQRFVAIHCNSPFPIELGAFTLVGRKKQALAAERRILAEFSEYKTRGEWLCLPMKAEVKQHFALMTKAIIADVTGKPVKWKRATGDQIRVYMSGKMRSMEA